MEGQSKFYGVPIIIGSKTAQAVREKFAVLEMDFITVKGKTEPEAVYTVLGGEDVARSDRFQQMNQAIGEMLTRYRQRDFEGAGKSIVRCREANDGFGLDNVFDLYVERLDAFRQKPPPADWNGAFVLETK